MIDQIKGQRKDIIKSISVIAICAASFSNVGFTIAGELEISQDGNSGEIDGRVIDESALFDLDITQAGLENQLSFVMESDVSTTIVQNGSNGFIDLDLKSQGDSLEISQHGSNNSVSGVLSGSVNDSSFLQNGSGNTVTFDISGTLNKLVVDQSGSGNLLNLGQQGSETNLKLTQSGSDNELDIQAVGNGMGIIITQSGNGEKIFIYQ